MAVKEMGKVMSARAVNPEVFPFSNIDIYVEQQLGTGSFGIVCKARCDKLICAAKLLHNIFFLSTDRGATAIKEKFEEECRMMATIVHPCIVQFIGVAITMDNQPVLLTELMDESLMKFIANISETHNTLSLHREVDIVNDIAMGLSYLHSRKIIHRDLSSNNILLTGHKAKITDFGVSKFFDPKSGSLTGLKYQTRCPGTPLFMPPEANADSPLYTYKLDIFSFGVICIHLLSRHTPSPSASQQQDRDWSGRVVFYPVSERERRAKDIELIPHKHCLRDLSISMIADTPEDRPTADELCDQLIKIKYSKSYTDSFSSNLSSSIEKDLQDRLKKAQKENWQLRQELERKNSDSNSRDTVTQLTQENTQLREEVAQLREQNTRITERLEFESSMESLSSTITVQESLPPSLTRGISTGPQWTKLGAVLPCVFKRGSVARVKEKVYISRPFSSVVYELDLQQKTWRTLPPYPNEEFSLIEFDGHLVAIGGVKSSDKKCSKMVSKYNPVGSWECKSYPNLFSARSLPACTSSKGYLVVAGGSSGRPCPKNALNTVEIYSKEHNQWYCCYNLPTPLSYPVAVIQDDNLFVISGINNDGPVWLMYKCSLNYLFKWSNRHMVPRTAVQQPWEQIQIPVALPSAVVLYNTLILFGGTMGSDGDSHDYSNQVLMYNEQRKNFGITLMPRKRGKCSVVTSSQDSVLVLGGCGSTAIDVGKLFP